MTVVITPELLGRGVIAHLDSQLASARRLLALILAQGGAIRSQDVEGVLQRLSDIKGEMALRETLEAERAGVLEAAGAHIGVPSGQVTVELLAGSLPASDGDAIRERSAELRGLLSEVAREHGINRALMRQELSFLDHLTRLIGHEGTAGDSRVLNVEA